MNVNDKSAGDTYLATEFTQFKNESQSAISGAGITPSSGSQVQLREAIMRNAISGQGCVASGTANAIILTTRSPFVAGAPSVLQDDATYSARITTANTGAVTINVNGIGVVPVKKNNYTDELEAGDIKAGLYDFVYSTSAGAFELVAKKLTADADLSSAPWTERVEVTANYTLELADVGKLFYIGSAVIADIEFEFGVTFPTNGVVWLENESNQFVGGGISGSPVRGIPYDGTNYYSPIWYNGTGGVERFTKLTDDTLNRGNG